MDCEGLFIHIQIACRLQFRTKQSHNYTGPDDALIYIYMYICIYTIYTHTVHECQRCVIDRFLGPRFARSIHRTDGSGLALKALSSDVGMQRARLRVKRPCLTLKRASNYAARTQHGMSTVYMTMKQVWEAPRPTSPMKIRRVWDPPQPHRSTARARTLLPLEP